MNNSFLLRLWISIRIWAVALLVNTAAGALYLCEFPHHFGDFWEYVQIGICYGAVFSLPVMLALVYMLGTCIYEGKTGKQILLTIFKWGLWATVLVFFLFCVLVIGIPSILLVLFGIALLSGSIGILSQYRSLLKCGTDYQ